MKRRARGQGRGGQRKQGVEEGRQKGHWPVGLREKGAWDPGKQGYAAARHGPSAHAMVPPAAQLGASAEAGAGACTSPTARWRQIHEPILTLSGSEALQGEFRACYAALAAEGLPIDLVVPYE